MNVEYLPEYFSKYLTSQFEAFGACSLSYKTFDHYKSWITHQYHGQMKYLADHLPAKANPQEYFSNSHSADQNHVPFVSALVVLQKYSPHPRPLDCQTPLKVALYAQGEDYHFWFKEKLQAAANLMQSLWPDQRWLACTDSSPLLERDLAAQAGLGWIGKNTCLINRRLGSFFFIGVLLTTLKLEDLQTLIARPSPVPYPPKDFCGKCNACLQNCPTKAFASARVLDARKCISYLTIEHRGDIPPELANQLQGWVFGCDVCQSVCPWNRGIAPNQPNPQENPQEKQALEWLASATNSQIQKKFWGSPLLRARPSGLRRNAKLALCPSHIKSLPK